MKTEPFVRYTSRYEEWFVKNRQAYESELRAVREVLPKEGRGVEIGVGTGRFAGPLGVEFGLDPSQKMIAIARKRGIEAVDGVAENLPYDSESFDYALMVTTLCFLNDVDKAFREVYRILRPGGSFINGFVDRESRIGREYEKHKGESVFYSVARFFSVGEVVRHLERAGYKGFEFRQTIFGSLSGISGIEQAKPGYGEGSFIVVKAIK